MKYRVMPIENNSPKSDSNPSSKSSLITFTPPPTRTSSAAFLSSSPSRKSLVTTTSSTDVFGFEVGSGVNIENPTNLTTSSDDITESSLKPSQKTETALEKFARYCGLSKEGRVYGKFEISGIVANYRRNRFLKNSGTTGEDANFTREALFIKVDKSASATQRDRDIINAIPDGEETEFRSKSIKYGNHNAMWEVLSSHLYGLTGLTAPDNRFVVDDTRTPRSDGSPDILVASPLITGYLDLGNFLINSAVLRFIPQDYHAIWNTAKTRIEAINKKHKDGFGMTPEEQMEKRDCLEKIYEIMPDYFHTEIEKSFAASKFVANWDFANQNLNNIGCRFTLDREGEVIGFESVFVDFGNCGKIGFKGKYKEDSLENANTEARNTITNPNEPDPSLSLTEKELELIIQKTSLAAQIEEGQNLQSLKIIFDQIDAAELKKSLSDLSEELANKTIQPLSFESLSSLSGELSSQENLPLTKEELAIRRSILRKTSHHITREDTDLTINSDKIGFLTISDIPRNLPFGFLLKKALEHKEEIAHNITDHLDPAFFRDSEIEMAFRLSLIPDEAIDHVINKWYLYEEFPTIFPIPSAHASDPNLTAAGLIATFKKRRDDLVNLIPEEVINAWIAKNPTQALAAEQEVELALLKKTLDPSLSFDLKKGEIPQPQKGITINHNNCFAARLKNKNNNEIYPTDIIQDELRIHSEHLRKENLEFLQNIEEQKDALEMQKETLDNYLMSLQDHNPPSNIGRNIRLQKVTVDSLQTTLNNTIAIKEQKEQEGVLDFMEKKMPTWKSVIGLDIKPNCSLLNLNRIREIFRIRNNIKPEVPNRIRDQQENTERNEIINQENSFTCNRVIEIFETLAKTRQKEYPSKLVKSHSSSNILATQPTLKEYDRSN